MTGRAAWAPEAEPERLTPARAEACREVAAAAGLMYPCHYCAAEPIAGAVVAFATYSALARHCLDVHGEARP